MLPSFSFYFCYHIATCY